MKEMLSSALMLLLLLHPTSGSLSLTRQAPHAQEQEKKTQPPATPPGSDPTQPPVKPEEPKAQQDQKHGQKAGPPANNPAERDATEPPIAIEQTKPIIYSFNPTKAAKELEVGNYYMKKSNWAAATLRFEEAVKWNPKYSAAYLRLGEAREKKGELSKAVEAYRNYLEMDPNSKKRKDVEKSIERLQKELQD